MKKKKAERIFYLSLYNNNLYEGIDDSVLLFILGIYQHGVRFISCIWLSVNSQELLCFYQINNYYGYQGVFNNIRAFFSPL